MPDIKKLDLNDPDTKSPDIVASNLEALEELFPEAFTEGIIDFEVLKDLLGAAVDERDEKYGLNWHGKRRARQIALTPSTGTLLPCPEESVDWDTTQNLMIEGDNLEVLKLLQKSYVGKVKLIYIDPPYNTGKDFVYPDDFRESVKNYLELTGQVEDGKTVSSNKESSGRFHTQWLSMMYPRIKLAKSLLKPSGIILVSLDSTEVSNARLIFDEIFGEENFVELITVVRSKNGMGGKEGFSTNSDFVLCYKRDAGVEGLAPFTGLPPTEEFIAKFDKLDVHGKYKMEGIFRKKGEGQKRSDSPGCFYPIFYAEDGSVSLEDDVGRVRVEPKLPDGTDGRWIWSPDFARERLHRLFASSGGTIYVKDYWSDDLRQKPKSVWDKSAYTTEYATEEIKALMGDKVFSTVKPLSLIQDLVTNATSMGDIVMDFFAGSGTTAHAVMLQNAADGGMRPFIMVQLPEPLVPSSKDQKLASDFCDELGKPRNIAELTKERIRRAAKMVKDAKPAFNVDTGFRNFKLAQSNIRAWEPDAADLENNLLKSAEHLVQGRKEQDVLYELLLKLGLDLCVPIEAKTIADKSVHSVGGGALIVCLTDGLTKHVVEELANGIVAWRVALAPAVDTRVVFKDSGFADDIAKTNMAAILNQSGITDVRSL